MYFQYFQTSHSNDRLVAEHICCFQATFLCHKLKGATEREDSDRNCCLMEEVFLGVIFFAALLHLISFRDVQSFLPYRAPTNSVQAVFDTLLRHHCQDLTVSEISMHSLP